MFFEKVFSYLYWYVRPIVKWFLRHTTGLCELQRICYGEPSGAARCQGVEFSLSHSKHTDIIQLIQYLNNISDKRKLTGENEREVLQHAIYTVLKVKRINVIAHKRFPVLFGKCIEQIWGYRQLLSEIEDLRTTQYDAENPEHESKLLLLWKLLMPSEPLESRLSKQWQDIGFQGDDPKTDFRGMGLLGLENLLYFAQEYPSAATHVLSHSRHPTYGYAFAIVGINLTSLAYRLVKDGAAKTHVYNVSRRVTTIKVFHRLYCYLFYEFDKLWIKSKPENMMDFSKIHNLFEMSVRTSLKEVDAVFKLNVSVDEV